MIHADGRDHARQRRVDDVGGVKPPAETDLEQHHIGRMLREQAERRHGLDFEQGDRRARIDALALFERDGEFVIADEDAATDVAEAEAFVDPYQ